MEIKPIALFLVFVICLISSFFLQFNLIKQGFGIYAPNILVSFIIVCIAVINLILSVRLRSSFKKREKSKDSPLPSGLYCYRITIFSLTSYIAGVILSGLASGVLINILFTGVLNKAFWKVLIFLLASIMLLIFGYISKNFCKIKDDNSEEAL